LTAATAVFAAFQPAARPLPKVGPQRADAGRTGGMDRSEVESHGPPNIDPDQAAAVDQLDLVGIGGDAPVGGQLSCYK
jgi:hypothetical protein